MLRSPSASASSLVNTDPQPGDTISPSRAPALDSVTVELYEHVDGESFEQRRLRLNKQETISFAPLRHRTGTEVAPYPAPDPATPTPPSTEDLAGQAFHVDDVDTKVLPSGWTMDEHGYLQLTDRTTDFFVAACTSTICQRTARSNMINWTGCESQSCSKSMGRAVYTRMLELIVPLLPKCQHLGQGPPSSRSTASLVRRWLYMAAMDGSTTRVQNSRANNRNSHARSSRKTRMA